MEAIFLWNKQFGPNCFFPLVQKLPSIPQFLDAVPLQITVHENKFALPTELVEGEC